MERANHSSRAASRCVLPYPGAVDNADVFVKKAARGNIGEIAYESAGLDWLRRGGAPVVRILQEHPESLVLQRLHPTSPNRVDAREFGKALAHLHASGALGYGVAPGDYVGPGYMGRAPLELVPDTQFHAGFQWQTWGEFYAQLRIRPYLTGVFTPAQRERILAVCALLESGELEHDEPQLVTKNQCGASRIHGDLWAGNVVWTARGGVLIDPAAQGGHAEEDLAALALFGAPHLGGIIRGYQDVSPLAPGWEGRVGLHQLHILVVHCYLFGSIYVPDMMARIDAILKEHRD